MACRPTGACRECRTSGGVVRHNLAKFSPFVRPQLLLQERADHDVVAVWISERKLPCPGGGVHVRLFVESRYKPASSLKCHVEIINTEEQEKSVSRSRRIRGHQGRMVMRPPLVEAQ